MIFFQPTFLINPPEWGKLIQRNPSKMRNVQWLNKNSTSSNYFEVVHNAMNTELFRYTDKIILFESSHSAQ